MNKIAVIFDSFDDAMNAHKSLFILLREKGYVTLRDFDNITRANNKEYTHIEDPSGDIFVSDMYDMQGWTYLCGTTVEEFKNNKHIIVMPEMINFGTNKKHIR